MLKRPKRDIFEFADGKQITLGDLPAGLIFDVLAVPGSEQLSGVLNVEPVVHDEEETEKEPLPGTFLDAGGKKGLPRHQGEKEKGPARQKGELHPSCATTPGGPEHGGNAGPNCCRWV